MHECMYGAHVCAGSLGGQGRAMHLQELEFLVVASCHINVGYGNQIYILRTKLVPFGRTASSLNS